MRIIPGRNQVLIERSPFTLPWEDVYPSNRVRANHSPDEETEIVVWRVVEVGPEAVPERDVPAFAEQLVPGDHILVHHYEATRVFVIDGYRMTMVHMGSVWAKVDLSGD